MFNSIKQKLDAIQLELEEVKRERDEYKASLKSVIAENDALKTQLSSHSDNPNHFLLLDMQFEDLDGVKENYGQPELVPEINWIVSKSSYACVDNGDSGIYDFIFNLNMLEHYILEGDIPTHLEKQLTEIKNQGYDYILFNQGC